jgi:hypothetical protein
MRDDAFSSLAVLAYLPPNDMCIAEMMNEIIIYLLLDIQRTQSLATNIYRLSDREANKKYFEIIIMRNGEL